jgi:hypothetical protein
MVRCSSIPPRLKSPKRLKRIRSLSIYKDIRLEYIHFLFGSLEKVIIFAAMNKKRGCYVINYIV